MADVMGIVSKSLMDAAVEDESQRLAAMRKRQNRFDGIWPNPLGKTPLDPRGEDNTTVNFARKTVETSAYYLFGREVTFEVVKSQNQPTQPDPGKDSPEEMFLQQCWEANRKMSMLMEMAIGAGTSGHCFVRLLEPVTPSKYPRVCAVNPAFVTPVCDPQDYRNVLQYRIQWTGVDPDSGRPVTYRDDLVRTEARGWQTIESLSYADSPVFRVTGTFKWPFPCDPIYSCKNRPTAFMFWGMSDLEDDVLEINEAVSFVLSDINRILRAHGHPLTVVTGAEAVQIDRSVGSTLYLPDAEATVKNLEMESDLAAAQNQLKVLTELYHELTSIPEVTTGKLENVGQLSGLAMQILYGPLVALTTVKQIYYGELLKDVCKGILAMGGYTNVTTVNLQWPNIIPADPAADANTAVARQAAGVSKDTTISELGYNPVAEAQKRQKEQKTAAALAMQSFDRGKEPDDKEDDEE